MTGGFLSRKGVDGLLLATPTYDRNSKDNFDDTDSVRARPSAWVVRCEGGGQTSAASCNIKKCCNYKIIDHFQT